MHADVFRPPAQPILLCASLGTGMQMLSMTAISIFCAMLGFLSPANRGGLLTATLLLFVLMGVPAGYFSSHTYKSIKGTDWKKATVFTATLYPGIVFFTFFVLNFFIWGEASSGAMPFGTMVALLLMWFGISVPLVFVGAFFGFKAKLADPPTRTNEIPRQIPAQAWYMGPMFNILMGGILPFGAIFIELFFIMTSVWLQVTTPTPPRRRIRCAPLPSSPRPRPRPRPRPLSLSPLFLFPIPAAAHDPPHTTPSHPSTRILLPPLGARKPLLAPS